MPVINTSGAFAASRTPIADKNGMATWSFVQILQTWQRQLSNGLNSLGQLVGDIFPTTKIVGRAEGIGVTVQNISQTGVMLSAGLAPATPLLKGAVIMPPGAVGITLGTAAMQPVAAFDAAGSAATAQTNAEAYAAAAATAAQTNAEGYADTVGTSTLAAAEAFSSDASNLSSGTVAAARLPGLSVTIVTAKLTTANGSMTFTNGILTAQTPAT